MLSRFAPLAFFSFVFFGSSVPVASAQPQDESTRLLSEYVAIDTSNPPGDTRKAADFLAAILEQEGIPVTRTWIYPATGRNVLKRLASYWSFTFSAVFGCLSGPRPDAILVESPPLFLGLSGLLVARLRGARSTLNVSAPWTASA